MQSEVNTEPKSDAERLSLLESEVKCLKETLYYQRQLVNRTENALIELRIRTCLAAAMLALTGEALSRDAREALEQLAALDTTLYGCVGHLSRRTTPLGEAPEIIPRESLVVDERAVRGNAERDWREARS